MGRLRESRVGIHGTVVLLPDLPPGVRLAGRTRDLLVMTTTYGRTEGLDAASGALLWSFSPAAYSRWADGADHHATPVADPSGSFVFAASPDGRIHKLALGDGSEARSGAWPASSPATRRARRSPRR